MIIKYYQSKQQMDIQLKQTIESWPEWIAQFQFDPVLGYLINPDFSPASFELAPLIEILKQLPKLNESGEIIKVINQMSEIKINHEQASHKQMVILHDYCSYLTHSYIKYLRQNGKTDYQITIPKNLAVPLAESAGFLRVKTGMATGICYNWQFNHQLHDLDLMTIDDIDIRYFYSTQKEFEELFFKVSVVTSYLLGRIIKNCYELNCIITQQPNLTDEALQRLNKIKFYLKRIFEQNLQIQLKMDKQFFFYVLRVFVAGYQDVYFQGIDQRVSSSGGAGGYDPSFQSFERAFGLFFEDQIGNVQDKLRHGMPEQNRQLVDFFAENSLLREYCACTNELKTAYNDVLQGYAKYLKLHGTFIRNFILNMLPTFNPDKKYGQHGSGILRIIEKSKFVQQQELGENTFEHSQMEQIIN